jgi:hypothetical protein
MFSNQHMSATLALGLALVACGSDDGDEGVSTSAPGVSASAGGSGVKASAPGVSASVDANGARASAGPVDVATAQLALDELTGNVDTAVTGYGTQNPVTAPAPGAAAATTPDGPVIAVQCASGGAASVGGYVNVVPVPVLVDVKVAIDYQGCVTQTGTTIAGNIDFSQTVAAGAGTPLRVETLYQGDVTLSGRVNARCPVDLNVLVDETGKAVQVQGKFCGQDASQLNLQVQPRWRAG